MTLTFGWPWLSDNFSYTVFNNYFLQEAIDQLILQKDWNWFQSYLYETPLA